MTCISPVTQHRAVMAGRETNVSKGVAVWLLGRSNRGAMRASMHSALKQQLPPHRDFGCTP